MGGLEMSCFRAATGAASPPGRRHRQAGSIAAAAAAPPGRVHLCGPLPVQPALSSQLAVRCAAAAQCHGRYACTPHSFPSCCCRQPLWVLRLQLGGCTAATAGGKQADATFQLTAAESLQQPAVRHGRRAAPAPDPAPASGVCGQVSGGRQARALAICCSVHGSRTLCAHSKLRNSSLTCLWYSRVEPQYCSEECGGDEDCFEVACVSSCCCYSSTQCEDDSGCGTGQTCMNNCCTDCSIISDGW